MKSSANGKFIGSTTVGGRGQVVIPAEARKFFNIKSGDKLVVFAKSEMISFIPADNFNNFLSEATKLMSRIKK
ncbi:MAG: AbrB/MazE/SpoVT family DNA-binding domain-containing protein [Candidatus Omnitrophica bacterium]|nr:AbrB/MazE/SpoVT family DNA-binding domain-containing protein [Candidatus Omnitrophota bacterium]MDD5237075.1 AbrB/MazE/SpoVT family DNA-binding domain-containing protein [Candidatus Omnitrophota bacterium]MDD5610140.1 AbrB/MazE/SpoVT family DNA-binding domain-containing protein [Candidatus Omnitrophota bacterium]